MLNLFTHIVALAIMFCRHTYIVYFCLILSFFSSHFCTSGLLFLHLRPLVPAPPASSYSCASGLFQFLHLWSLPTPPPPASSYFCTSGLFPLLHLWPLLHLQPLPVPVPPTSFVYLFTAARSKTFALCTFLSVSSERTCITLCVFSVVREYMCKEPFSDFLNSIYFRRYLQWKWLERWELYCQHTGG